MNPHRFHFAPDDDGRHRGRVAPIPTPDLSDLDPDDHDPIGRFWITLWGAQAAMDASPEIRAWHRPLARKNGLRLFTDIVCTVMGPYEQPEFTYYADESGVQSEVLVLAPERRDVRAGYVWVLTPRGRLLEHGPAERSFDRGGGWEYRFQHLGHPSLDTATILAIAVGAPWVNA